MNATDFIAEYLTEPTRESGMGWGRKAGIALVEQGFACAHCGCAISDDSMHLDHIIPFSRGGSNEQSNLQALCARCNLAKGNRSLPADHGKGSLSGHERLRRWYTKNWSRDWATWTAFSAWAGANPEQAQQWLYASGFFAPGAPPVPTHPMQQRCISPEAAARIHATNRRVARLVGLAFLAAPALSLAEKLILGG